MKLIIVTLMLFLLYRDLNADTKMPLYKTRSPRRLPKHFGGTVGTPSPSTLGATCGHKADKYNRPPITTPCHRCPIPKDIKDDKYDKDEEIPPDPQTKYFETFPSYCHFLAAQCRDKAWNTRDRGWVFLHFGPCVSDDEALLPIMRDTQVINRKKEALKQYSKTNTIYTDPNFNRRCGVFNVPETPRKWIDKIDTVGSCYLLRMEQTTDFDTARKTCGSYGDGTNSVVLDNEVERDVVAELVAEEDPATYFYTDFDQWARFDEYNQPYPTNWQPATSNNESLHQIEYAPWTDNRSYVDDHEVYKGQRTMIYIQASDGRYNTGILNETTKGYALCEKHVTLAF